MYYINKQNLEKIYKYSTNAATIFCIMGVIVLASFFMMGMVLGNIQAETIETKTTQAKAYQPQIAKEVLRFHVIANSDSEDDQKLKLKVKEAVLETVRPMLKEAGSKQAAEKIIQRNIEEIEAAADKVICEEGYKYRSKGVLGKTTFPVKKYGDMVFPAGEYDAFRILLGDGEGKNWWCVMFPTLCYVDETYDVITEENKEEFREILTEEQYASLLTAIESVKTEKKETEMDNNEKRSLVKEQGEGTTKVFYKAKSLIWLNKMIDYFQK